MSNLINELRKYEERWLDITYSDIKKDRYQVSNMGRIRSKYKNKFYNGCNPDNEKGYVRITLKSENGTLKKYPIHRIVFNEFGNDDMVNKEINHIDGNPLNNSIDNLEVVTRKENAEHAAINHLYQSGENHYRSRFTNNQVEEICRLISEGYPINKVIHMLDLNTSEGDIYSTIDKIINGKSWKDISSKYKFDYDTYHYKTYKKSDIEKMAKMLFVDRMRNIDVVNQFPQYNRKNLIGLVKALKAHRIYSKITNKYK